MKRRTSDDFKNFSGNELDLLTTHMNIMKHQLRLKLLRGLLSRKLATRDIFSFARGQSDQRLYRKTPDWTTIKTAMKAKLLDVKTALQNSYKDRTELRLKLTEEFSGSRKHLLKKNINKMKQAVNSERLKLWEVYKKKINHYLAQQKPLEEKKEVKIEVKTIKPTAPPDALRDFSNLSIFGTAKDLPKPRTPLGPFICDQPIELTKWEREILSKDPKFCLGYVPSELEFQTELERMLSKERYDDINKRALAKKDMTAARCDIEGFELDYKNGGRIKVGLMDFFRITTNSFFFLVYLQTKKKNFL